MARRPVFLSFCYKDDVTRVQQIRNMGTIIEGQPLLSANEFETIKRQGEAAIKKWIDEQLKYKQCLIVLIGENTANRPWVQYEIRKAYELGKPMFGIYIHNLKGLTGVSRKGADPFVKVFGISSEFKCYDPFHMDYNGLRAYNEIEKNIGIWIENAISENKWRSV